MSHALLLNHRGEGHAHLDCSENEGSSLVPPLAATACNWGIYKNLANLISYIFKVSHNAWAVPFGASCTGAKAYLHGFDLDEYLQYKRGPAAKSMHRAPGIFRYPDFRPLVACMPRICVHHIQPSAVTWHATNAWLLSDLQQQLHASIFELFSCSIGSSDFCHLWR